MYVCICNGVTDDQVREAALSGYREPEELAAQLGLDGDECCGRCRADMGRICSYAGPVAMARK